MFLVSCGIPLKYGENGLELICFEVEPGRVELRPANSTRNWMDATPGSFAYRCLPLTMANSHGWEILCPANFEISWNGGENQNDIEINSDAPMSATSPNDYLAFLLGKKPFPPSYPLASIAYPAPKPARYSPEFPRFLWSHQCPVYGSRGRKPCPNELQTIYRHCTADFGTLESKTFAI